MLKEINKKEGPIEKYVDERVIELGKKIKNALILKPIGFHVKQEDHDKYTQIKKRYKDNGINLSPEGGGHMVRVNNMVDKMFFQTAKDLGANEIMYTEKRLKTFLHEFNKLDHVEIEKTMAVRDNAIKAEDAQIVFSVKKIGP